MISVPMVNEDCGAAIFFRFRCAGQSHRHVSMWSEALCESSNPPMFTQRLGSQTIGLFVVDELVFLEVVFHLAVQVERDVRRVAGDVRVAGRIGISLRLAA